MHVSVTLRGRAHFAALLHSLMQAAEQRKGIPRLDQRNRRTWRQVIVGVLVQRSTRLLALGRFVAPQRRASSVKAAAQGVAYFLKDAAFPVADVSTGLLEEAVRQIDPAHLVTYEGKVLLVLDPTEYAKRSRGQGKCGRQMQHIGRVRAPKPKTSAGKKQRKQQTRSTPAGAQSAKGTRAAPTEKRVATTYGYVDIWAGLALKGKQFLPLARQLFSSRHPTCTSQNAVEEAVVGQALDLLRRLALEAIVVGDRGVGRKEFLIRLAKQEQAAVLRVDADITVYPSEAPDGLLLDAALARQPWRGTVTWDRGEHGRVRCRLRTLCASIRFSRTGRKDDVQEATVTFIEAVPLAGPTESLVLATTLPVDTAAQARAIVRLYAQRWAIETAFETMHAWGQERFMVRSWTAIDRLLWVLAVAYALVVLALHTRPLRRFRAQAIAVLKQLSVVGDRLTPGKLAEAIGLDFARHTRAWLALWRM